MDVFLMIRRHKTTIFTDAKESSTVLELKCIIEGILKRPPEEQRLYKDDQPLDDTNTLIECGFSSETTSPFAPATVGLALWVDGAFEDLTIEPYSTLRSFHLLEPEDSESIDDEDSGP